MKRVISSLMVAVALLMVPMAKAENVTAEQARDAAAHFLQHNTNLTRITADQLTLAYQWNNDELGVASMYLFTTPTVGWIIMSANTAMTPVVAFTDEDGLDVDNMAPQMRWWLSKYNKIVCAVQSEDAEKPLGTMSAWESLINHSLKGTKSNHVFLKTAWDQGDYTGTTYNMYSPVIHDSVCPTGCVATALAQICKYYEFPKKPKGTPSYWWVTGNKRMTINFDTVPSLNYSLMPTQLTTNTSVERKKEVSRLAYYVGLGASMNYRAALSGANSNVALTGMRNYFKYSRATLLNRVGTNDTQFLNSIRRELMQNRVLYMGGESSGSQEAHGAGHAWVCDGYQDEDTAYYHMNWGWGPRGGNAFYDLVANNMSVSIWNFNLDQEVAIGMIPPQDSTSRIIGVHEVEGTVELGAPYPNPAALEIVLPYSCHSTSDLQVYSISGRLVESRRLQAGSGEVTLRVDALPSGIYIYRMGNAHGKFVVR